MCGPTSTLPFRKTLERLAEYKLSTLRETQCEKNQPLESDFR